MHATSLTRYLGSSHYPREEKGGATLRTLAQCDEGRAEGGLVRGVDKVKESQDCDRYSDGRTIDCRYQRLGEVDEG